MTRGWTSRVATAADEGDQVRLFNACFHKQKGQDTLRWRYRENPHGEAISRVACDGDGRVVGSYSYVPRRFRRDGEPLLLMQASDAMTDEAWRGQGIFTGLDDEVCAAAGRAGAPWVFAYSGRQSLKGFLRNGWRVLGYARMYRRAFRHRRGLLRLGRMGPLVAWAAPLLDLLQGWRDAARLPGGDRLVRMQRFDERVDALFEACVPSRGLMGERSARWLNWRFVDTPTGRHERLGLFRADRLEGYVVAEFVAGNAYLVDHLARDGPAADALLTAFTGLARARGMEEASALLFDHHPSAQRLRRLGFRRPLRNRPFRDRFPFIARRCGGNASHQDEAMTRWHVMDGDRDAEHMSP